MYDVIVLGATFAAAGIARVKKEKCLILDSKPYAGWEFFSALHFGTDYGSTVPMTPEGQEMNETFLQRMTVNEERICISGCAAPFYKRLEEMDVLLNMQIISVSKQEDGFVCEAHGVSGYRTFRAKRVVDTRCPSEACVSKTYNLLMDGSGEPECPEGVSYEAWGPQRNYVLRCQVPTKASFQEARKTAMQVLESLPEGHKLVLLADEFDLSVKGEYPKEKNGISYLISKAYANPILAYEAGALFAKGGEA